MSYQWHYHLCGIRGRFTGGGWCFQGGSVVKDMPASTGDVGDMGSIPGLRGSPGKGNGNPLQYSCLENSKGRGAWWAAVHGGHKSLDPTEQLNTYTEEGNRGKKLKESHRGCWVIFSHVGDSCCCTDSILVMPLSIGSPDWARKVLHPGPGCGSAFSSCLNSVTINIWTLKKYLGINCVCLPFAQSKFSVGISWVNEWKNYPDSSHFFLWVIVYYVLTAPTLQGFTAIVAGEDVFTCNYSAWCDKSAGGGEVLGEHEGWCCRHLPRKKIM